MSDYATFAALHRKGDPLVLFNIWDPGSARAVAEAGAPAIATGSWSVAAARGSTDGEALPIDEAIENAAEIVAAVKVPVTIDFEGGYAQLPADVGANVGRLAARSGAAGCNFEDQQIGGDGLHGMADQAARIAAIRQQVGTGFFINARTDLFLKATPETHADHIGEAIERAAAYAEAGASGFFAPGLTDPALIEGLCAASRLPVNIMAFPGVPDTATLAELGVARISHGPRPYRQVMQALTVAAAAFYR